VGEFKSMVKALHRAGLEVVLEIESVSPEPPAREAFDDPDGESVTRE